MLNATSYECAAAGILLTCVSLPACRQKEPSTAATYASEPRQSQAATIDQSSTQPEQPQTPQSRARPLTVTNYGSLAAWDTDGNGEISRQEFDRRLADSAIFGDWDLDRDQQVSDLELVTSLYNAWDIDGDDRVDVYEYRWGNGAWFAGGTMYGRFQDLDGDGDQELTLVELQKGRNDFIREWDTDRNSYLAEKEFSTGLFNAWDVNGDEIVDMYEWTRAMSPQPGQGVSGGHGQPGQMPGSSSGQPGQTQGSSSAPTAVSYGAIYVYDEDRDGAVSRQEFEEASKRAFAAMDSSSKGALGDKELRESIFAAWDIDGDQQVNQYEFSHNAGAFFPEKDKPENFKAWDANGDGTLTKQEFVNYSGKQRLFAGWDKNRDRKVDQPEFTAALFSAWDTNGDGQLDRAEWHWW